MKAPAAASCFGDAVGERVGLRDGEEWCAGADGVEDAGLQVAERDDLGLFAGLGCVAGLHGWRGFEAGGLADLAVGAGVRGDAGGDDEVVVFAGFEIDDRSRMCVRALKLFSQRGAIPETAILRTSRAIGDVLCVDGCRWPAVTQISFVCVASGAEDSANLKR